MNHSKEFWSVREVVEFSGFCKATVLAWLDAGRFPGACKVRVGSGERFHWRIPRREVLAVFERSELQPVVVSHDPARYPALKAAGLL